MNPSVKGICKLMFKTCKNFHFRELLLQREEFIIMCYPCIQSSSEILGCFFFLFSKNTNKQRRERQKTHKGLFKAST